MTTNDEEPDQLSSDVERRFVALSIVEETPPSSGAQVSFHDLFALATDPDFDLTDDQYTVLQTNPRLLADDQALRARYVQYAMPAAAAASTGELDERNFAGVSVRILSMESSERRVCVLITLPEGGAAPRILRLQGRDGTWIKEALPKAEDNMIELIKDESTPRDARILQLLRDPRTTGAFLRAPE